MPSYLIRKFQSLLPAVSSRDHVSSPFFRSPLYSSRLDHKLTRVLEVSENARAVCKNKECKDAGVKIQKGELRFGTLVTINEHTSWSYKHW
jgi:hypothetical protein